MIFGYPIPNNTNNWLHICLYNMINSIHTAIDSGATPSDWPDIIPSAHRSDLLGYTGIRDRLDNYKKAIIKLSSKTRNKILKCLYEENQIESLLSCASTCDKITDLPKIIQEPIIDLFSFSFKKLTDLGIRDIHYKCIHDKLENDVCPFCGCEFFSAPGAPREDLDHYLARKIYPFAAANLFNLPPMGMVCNEKYKLAQNLLEDVSGNRRVAFYPYKEHSTEISLLNSTPLPSSGILFEWKIDFIPDSPECQTWDDVFKIKERYRRDILDKKSLIWLNLFKKWHKEKFHLESISSSLVVKSLETYLDSMPYYDLTGRAFLCPLFFRALLHNCANNDTRLLLFMCDLLNQ